MKPTHGAARKYGQMQMTMCLLAWHICIWIMIHSKEWDVGANRNSMTAKHWHPMSLLDQWAVIQNIQDADITIATQHYFGTLWDLCNTIQRRDPLIITRDITCHNAAYTLQAPLHVLERDGPSPTQLGTLTIWLSCVLFSQESNEEPRKNEWKGTVVQWCNGPWSSLGMDPSVSVSVGCQTHCPWKILLTASFLCPQQSPYGVHLNEPLTI